MNKLGSADYFQECRLALRDEQALSLASTDGWSHVDRAQVHKDWDVLYKKLARSLLHLRPSEPAVQALIAEHYRLVSRFYPPSKRAYVGMSLFYAENEEMAKFHNGYDPCLLAFLGDAMLIYSQKHL